MYFFLCSHLSILHTSRRWGELQEEQRGTEFIVIITAAATTTTTTTTYWLTAIGLSPGGSSPMLVQTKIKNTQNNKTAITTKQLQNIKIIKTLK